MEAVLDALKPNARRRLCGFSVRFSFTTDYIYWGLGCKYAPGLHLGPLHWWFTGEYRNVSNAGIEAREKGQK